MKKPAIFAVFLVAALVVAMGILWPGQVLALRERRLYGQVAAKAVSADSFDSSEITLAQRISILGNAGGILPTMDFSAGAQLYDDEYALRRRFVRELRDFSAYFAPAAVLNDWMETTGMATEDFHHMPVSYLCAVDPNTGKTFLVGSMQDPNWEHFRLNMDMASGKITGGEIVVTDAEVDQEQCWILACGVANYLGLTCTECVVEFEGTGGRYLFESEDGEQMHYIISLEYQTWNFLPAAVF